MSGAGLSVRGVEVAWARFLRGGPSREVLALIRIGFASVVLANFLLVLPDVEAWWSEQGWFPLRMSLQLTDPHVWSLLQVLPATNAVLWTCYALAVTHAALLLIGLYSRINALAVFVWLISFQHRNFMVTDGEDTVMRLLSFFLVFTPLAERYSLDALLRKKRPARARSWLPEPRWGRRFLQLLPVLIVLSAGLEKLDGDVWWSGEALYYVTKLDDMFTASWLPRFLVDSPSALRVGTWLALAVEIGAPILIWFRETRRFALIALVLLHLGMMSLMNLFLFQPLMLLLWASHATTSELLWLRERLLSTLRILVRFFAGTHSARASHALFAPRRVEVDGTESSSVPAVAERQRNDERRLVAAGGDQ
jgi:hypothetical protein